jgi:hypothetical protein
MEGQMRLISAIFILLLGAVAFSFAGDDKTPLDVKLGLWETTTTHTTAGAPPIPQERLDRLTPEQRAKFEERMKNRSGQASTETHRSCLTKEQLEKHFLFEDDKGMNCTRNIVSATRRKIDASLECSNPMGIKLNGTIKIDSPDSETANGTIHMVSAGNGNSMNFDSTFKSKWLGASCGDVE